MILMSYEDCQLIKNIGNWEIKLTRDNNFFQENNFADWYGYQKQISNKDLRIFSLQGILLNNNIVVYISRILKRT